MDLFQKDNHASAVTVKLSIPLTVAGKTSLLILAAFPVVGALTTSL
jgi:hypothetical protein